MYQKLVIFQISEVLINHRQRPWLYAGWIIRVPTAGLAIAESPTWVKPFVKRRIIFLWE